MKQEYNVIGKKEFIIYTVFSVIYTIFMLCIGTEIINFEVLKNLILVLFWGYIPLIVGLIINIIFNLFKIENKKAKKIINVLYNISAITYNCILVLLCWIWV